jgi:hypothetical protein
MLRITNEGRVQNAQRYGTEAKQEKDPVMCAQIAKPFRKAGVSTVNYLKYCCISPRVWSMLHHVKRF